MASIKILVAGHFGAGKTTFVKTASSNTALTTEKRVFHPSERQEKSTTTTAMDFSNIRLDKQNISIFAIPGQKRFEFMWKILAKNTRGYIFLFDSTNPKRWSETLEQFEMFMEAQPAPYVFVANKQDLPEARSVKEIRETLSVSSSVKFLPCVATDRDTVLNILMILLEEIKIREGKHEYT